MLSSSHEITPNGMLIDLCRATVPQPSQSINTQSPTCPEMQYGAKVQRMETDILAPLSKDKIKRVQDIIGTLLYTPGLSIPPCWRLSAPLPRDKPMAPVQLRVHATNSLIMLPHIPHIPMQGYITTPVTRFSLSTPTPPTFPRCSGKVGLPAIST